MKKLVLGALLLALGTACPKVERRVYTFDLKTNQGVLYFENIVTDAPEDADSDFMEIVNKVIEGTKLEEEYPGWRIQKKELYESKGRLDGKMVFTFDDPQKAGVYKHDKKSPYIWCASRSEEQTIVATNGDRIDDTLPGCVVWDRKATTLSVTVKTASLMGSEKPLVASFNRWKNGEPMKEKSTTNPFEGGLFGDGDNPLGELMKSSMVDTTKLQLTKASQKVQVHALRKGLPDTLDPVFPDAMPTDAWGNPFKYVTPGPDGKKFDLISLGSDGAEGGTGDAADIRLSEL